MKTLPILRFALILAGCSPTFAAPVIHEPFAQTAGNLNGKAASSTGLTGNWTVGSGTVNVVSPATITHGALANSSGQTDALTSANTNARVAINGDLATAGLLDNGATLWFSLVFQKTAGGGSNEHAGFALGSSYLTAGPSGVALAVSGSGIGFYARDTSIRVVNWTGTTNVVATSGVAGPSLSGYSTPTILVGKIEWGATASDVEKITLYKPSLDLSSLGTAYALSTVPAFDQSTLNTISFAQRNSSGTYTFDEIRFGATQADVLPVSTTVPTLLSITDDKNGGPIGEDVGIISYNLTFDQHMDPASFDAADFDNTGTATTTIGTITQLSPTVIRVQVLPTTTGTVQLRIPASSVIKSLAQMNLDTTSAILDDTTITINAGTTDPNTPTSNRYWDGTTASGTTDGASQGGTATWDNGTTTNWDRGAGFENPVAWNNSNNNTAIFGGTAGTVTLDTNITLDGLTVSLPTATGSGYSIGNVGEDNTLAFSGAKIVTTTATGTGTNQDVTIRAGIAGSPTMNINGRLANSVDQFSLLPGAGVTQAIGSLNMLNSNASNKRLILGGDSTGNVVDTVTWAVTSNQLMLTKAGAGSWTINNNLAFNTGGSRAARLYVEQGTLTLGGTNNFFTHKVGVSTVRESAFTASGTASKLIAKGTFTIGDNREFFYVQNLGTISPGPGVATLNVTWNANNTTAATNGEFNMQTGSTYEWDIASNTSTDVINVTTGASNNGNLNLGNITIQIKDAGVTTPIAAGDQLPAFTYETGAQTVARSIGTVTLDTSALGAGWSGTPSLVDNGTGTIYVTGLTFTSGGAPEIAVEQPPGTDIANNGSKDFGTVTLGSNASLQFTIRNTGTAALNLTGTPPNYVVIGGTHAGDFTVTSQPSTPVASSGGTTTFTVQFTPGGAGPRSATLTITNNDSDEGTFVVNVSGTGQTPYDAWSGGAGFTTDTNADGIKNGVAWVIGAADPTENAIGKLPTFDNSSDLNYFIFTYRRLDTAVSAGTGISVLYGSDLVGFTTAVHDGTNIIISTADNFYGSSPGIDKVEVKIKKTLAVGGKLFAHLEVTSTP